MNLTPEQQLKLVSVLGCLVESGKQYNHNLLDEIEEDEPKAAAE